MSDVGQRETLTQSKVIRLLVNNLGYEYLGKLVQTEQH